MITPKTSLCKILHDLGMLGSARWDLICHITKRYLRTNGGKFKLKGNLEISSVEESWINKLADIVLYLHIKKSKV